MADVFEHVRISTEVLCFTARGLGLGSNCLLAHSSMKPIREVTGVLLIEPEVYSNGKISDMCQTTYSYDNVTWFPVHVSKMS